MTISVRSKEMLLSILYTPLFKGGIYLKIEILCNNINQFNAIKKKKRTDHKLTLNDTKTVFIFFSQRIWTAFFWTMVASLS